MAMVWSCGAMTTSNNTAKVAQLSRCLVMSSCHCEFPTFYEHVLVASLAVFVSTVLVLLHHVAPCCTWPGTMHRFIASTQRYLDEVDKNGFGRLNCHVDRGSAVGDKKKGQVGHACGDTDMMASLRKNFLPNANSPFQLAKANAQAVSIWK